MKVDTQSVLTDLQETRATLARNSEDISVEIERLLAQQDAISKQLASLDVVIGLYSQDNSSENKKPESVKPDVIEVSNSEASQDTNNQDADTDTDNVSVNTDEVDFQLNGQTSLNGKKMTMRQIVREKIGDLPTLFTKEDIQALIVENGGADKRINDNTLSSVIRSLKDDDLIEVKVPATGRSKQIYTKVD